jgi:hypothetical protein
VALGVLQRRVLSHVHEVPVVEPRATHGVLVDAEAELSHQVERRTGPRTEASDVPGVRLDLGFHEHDVEGSCRRWSAEPGVVGHVQVTSYVCE